MVALILRIAHSDSGTYSNTSMRPSPRGHSVELNVKALFDFLKNSSMLDELSMVVHCFYDVDKCIESARYVETEQSAWSQKYTHRH